MTQHTFNYIITKKGGKLVNNEKWYNFQEASLKEGRSKNWLQQHYKRNPDYFKEDTIKRIGRIYAINDEGIEYFKQHLKKEGDHVIALTNT